jgi:putative RecB family exonuclease
MTDQPHLSVTQLRMYLRCPLQYFFRYACGLKMPPMGETALGRTIHETLKENYRQKIQSGMDLPLEQITDFFSDRWEKNAPEAVFSDDENAGHLKDDGIGLLAAYHKLVAPHVQPVAVEQEFLVNTGHTALPLNGYIDLIDDKGVIIDHKTTKRSFPVDAAAKDIQLTAYAMAHRALFNRPESSVRLDVMVRNKQPKIQQLQATRTQEDIDRFLRLIQQAERGINAEIFYPNENYMCGYCGYREMCEKW